MIPRLTPEAKPFPGWAFGGEKCFKEPSVHRGVDPFSGVAYRESRTVPIRFAPIVERRARTINRPPTLFASMALLTRFAITWRSSPEKQ